jgi:hypothetical protein
MVTNIVGPPVRGENCYGREAFVELVWEKLAVGHVLLAAPRRFGKTSILYRLIDQPRPGCQFYKGETAEPADVEAFNHLMSDLENDFYIRFDLEARKYEFACKLLRDWWLRHYAMEAEA